MDIGARRDRRPLIAFLECPHEQKTEKVYRSRRERFPVSGASQHEAQNSGRICMHYTALLQNNASFPIIYPWQQVKNLGKT